MNHNPAAPAGAPVFITLDQHARALATPVNTVRNAIYRGDWPVKTVKIGRRHLVALVDHQALVDSLLGQTQKPAVSRREVV